MCLTGIKNEEPIVLDKKMKTAFSRPIFSVNLLTKTLILLIIYTSIVYFVLTNEEGIRKAVEKAFNQVKNKNENYISIFHNYKNKENVMLF